MKNLDTFILGILLGAASIAGFFLAYFLGEAHIASLIQQIRYVFDF